MIALSPQQSFACQDKIRQQKITHRKPGMNSRFISRSRDSVSRTKFPGCKSRLWVLHGACPELSGTLQVVARHRLDTLDKTRRCDKINVWLGLAKFCRRDPKAVGFEKAAAKAVQSLNWRWVFYSDRFFN